MLEQETRFRALAELSRKYPRVDSSRVVFECLLRDERDIYRVKAPGLENHVLKTVGRGRKSESEFVVEYERILAFNRAADTRGLDLGIPRAVALLDNDALLMTELPGKNLKSLYFQTLAVFWRRAELVDAVSGSAVLLASLHGLTQRRMPWVATRENRLENLRRMIAAIDPDTAAPADSALFEAVESAFIRATDIAELEICEIHGNFALRNLTWDGHRAGCLDFEDSRIDTIYFDVGLLLAELSGKSLYPGSRALNLRLSRAFLDAYQGTCPLDPSVLNAFVLYHLVWSYYEITTRGTVSGGPRGLWCALSKRHLRREIESRL